MDGKVFLTRDFEPGLTANPFHANCHCTTVPYFDGFNEDEVEFARAADGTTRFIFQTLENVPLKTEYNYKAPD